MKYIKQLIKDRREKRSLRNIRNHFSMMGFDIDDFSDRRIKQAMYKAAFELHPATTFTAEEAAGVFRELGKSLIKHSTNHPPATQQ